MQSSQRVSGVSFSRFGPIKGWNSLNFGEMRHCRTTEELSTSSVLATVYLNYIFF